jgi:GT2 family glycosyltransferase/2-polyprenyl-3-methyl-5-hydroxy-6-metoxy-1,4-benzoquinol methylase
VSAPEAAAATAARLPRATDLTVVLPTRGRPEALAQTLGALAEQTLQGFETVVVFDGEPVRLPARVPPGTLALSQDQAGPGAARNRGVAATNRPLLLFLGADMIPAGDLVERHLERHAREPAMQLAVLGRARWHRSLAGRPLHRWIERSGAQFDYRQLEREGGAEAGFGRFYSCNVSLKRALFDAGGGFDPAFAYDYEDLDLAYRLHEHGMVLRYEPRAVSWHLHGYTPATLAERYRCHARGEWMMARKHPWFRPWFRDQLAGQASLPPVSRLWPELVDRLPVERLEGTLLEPVRARLEERTDRYHHQFLAGPFLEAWEGCRELSELQDYLGDRFEIEKLWQSVSLVDRELAAAPDEGTFYRTSEFYLYDLTSFAMSGAKEPYRRVLQRLVPAGASVLDYGCGIGSDGLRLLEQGYRVAFAEFDNPSSAYLRWRLRRRGLQAPVHDLDRWVPGGFDLAYAFDVIEHVPDPFAFLAELESRAEVVMVNLLAPYPGDIGVHGALPVRALLLHAARRGLLYYRRHHHGRSHLIAYRSPASRAPRVIPLSSLRRLGRGRLLPES